LKIGKQVTMTGYRVQFVDLREPKPRPVKEAVSVLDAAQLDALGLLGQNPVDEIEQRYERGGFHVTSVEKLGKRVARLDLEQLWESAVAPNSPEGGAKHAEA